MPTVPAATTAQKSSCCSGARNEAETRAPPKSIVTSLGIGDAGRLEHHEHEDRQVAVPGDLLGDEVVEDREQRGTSRACGNGPVWPRDAGYHRVSTGPVDARYTPGGPGR